MDYTSHNSSHPFVFIESYAMIVFFSAENTFIGLERYMSALYSPRPVSMEPVGENDKKSGEQGKYSGGNEGDDQETKSAEQGKPSEGNEGDDQETNHGEYNGGSDSDDEEDEDIEESAPTVEKHT